MGLVTKVVDAVKAGYSLIERNKVALAGIGSAVIAIYHGIRDGVDTLTLTTSIGTLVAAITHLTVTPLSKPKTSDGTPLVPSPAPAADPGLFLPSEES